MNKQLRVLIIEDIEKDNVLLLQELSRSGYNPIFTLINTPVAMTTIKMLDLFDKPRWDFIIADISISNFNILDLLEILHKIEFDLPLIVLSDKWDENNAISIIKAGAYDFILKDDMKRLIPTIERMLREVKLREEHWQIEKKCYTIIQNFNNMIWTLDKKGKFTYINKRVEEITGYKLDEIRGKSFTNIVFPKDLPKVQKIFNEIMVGKTQEYEINVITKNGNVIVLFVNTFPIFETNQIKEMVSSSHHIPRHELIKQLTYKKEMKYKAS